MPLDAALIEQARAAMHSHGSSDAEVVERAMNAYLLGDLLDAVQHHGDSLDDEVAERVAYDELREHRKARSHTSRVG